MPSGLQHEIRKRRPFDLPEEEAVLNLLRTTGVLHAPFDQLFASRGLSSPQYNILRILQGHGGDGLPCSEIGAQMVTRMPDVTRLVDRLEQAGHVARSRTAADRRVVLVRLTDGGRKVLAQLEGPVRELNKQTLGHLSKAELAELNRLLVKARQPAAE